MVVAPHALLSAVPRHLVTRPADHASFPRFTAEVNGSPAAAAARQPRGRLVVDDGSGRAV